MSFSYKVKKEISLIPLGLKIESKSELYAILLLAANKKNDKIILSFESKCVIERVQSLIEDLCLNSFFNVKYAAEQKSPSKCVYNVEIKNKISVFENHLKLMKECIDFNTEACLKSFLRGAFLACASITDPTKEYHLEFDVASPYLCNNLIYAFNACKNSDFSLKIVQRRNRFVAYLKENEKITDFLVMIGAQKCAMEIMQIKMLKEVRNNINRATNFETANLSKITNSSANQINAIKKIKSSKQGLSALPHALIETAKLRLNNPYASLKELAKLYKAPISKSGVNHRLKKIIEISQSL